MDKPLILAIVDFEKSLIELIERSGIPAFILKNSIEKTYSQLLEFEQQELQQAIEKYNADKKAEEKKSKSKKEG